MAMAFSVGRQMERQGIPGRECSSGYMGGQVHEDGSHHLLFSLWDWNASLHTAFGVKPISTDGGKTGCSAFGGEGTGGHCGAPLPGDDFMWEIVSAETVPPSTSTCSFLSGRPAFFCPQGSRYTFAAFVEEADSTLHGLEGTIWQAQVTNEESGHVTTIGQM